VKLRLYAFIQGIVLDVVDSAPESVFSPSSLDSSLIKSHSTGAPPYHLVSNVGIGRIRGLTVPQGPCMALYHDGNKKAWGEGGAVINRWLPEALKIP
jgi:hypothetical protein